MTWYDIAFSKSVRKRAIRVAIIVGIVLMMINHGDKLISNALTKSDIFKICLTFIVPYSVSTYSSVLTWLDERKRIYEQILKERQTPSAS